MAWRASAIDNYRQVRRLRVAGGSANSRNSAVTMVYSLDSDKNLLEGYRTPSNPNSVPWLLTVKSELCTRKSASSVPITPSTIPDIRQRFQGQIQTR